MYSALHAKAEQVGYRVGWWVGTGIAFVLWHIKPLRDTLAKSVLTKEEYEDYATRS